MVLPLIRIVWGGEGTYVMAAAREELDVDGCEGDGTPGTGRMRLPVLPPLRPVVLVTGAARMEGIGFHVARSFLTRGCHVVLCDIDGTGLMRAERALDPRNRLTRWRDKANYTGADDQFLMSVVCDVSDPDAVRTAKNKIRAEAPMVARLDRQRQRQRQLQRRQHETNRSQIPSHPCLIDILVQNAGIVTGKPLCALSADEISRTLSVNLSAHFYGLKEFLPDMIKHDHGFVVTVASMMGHIGGAHLAPYCAAKWGLLGLDECLRMELRRTKTSGVRTMVVCPYVVSTGMFRGAFSAGDGFVSSATTGGGSYNKDGNTWWRRAARRAKDMFIPALTAESVAEDIVYETMVRRKPTSWHARCSCGARGSVLVLPRRLAFAPAALRMIPIGLQEWILDFLGGVHGMTGFRGHGDGDGDAASKRRT